MLRFANVVLLVSVLALPSDAAAQEQQVLFPGQTGAELLASIKQEYRPRSVLSYSGAQDRIAGDVYASALDGTPGVFGVYTGFFVALDGQCSYGSCRSGDANQDVFNGGSGLNTEHTWPRSLLSGAAESDMHHLFPTRVDVNGARSNFLFADIPDSQTTTWYRGASRTRTVPGENRDEYSELLQGQAFEPREDHKGNVARALFYIDAVYTPSTSSAFPFDADQRRTLYEWHYADAVDQTEVDRTNSIAAFQADTPNPFVLDSTLIRRAYFPEIDVSVAPAPRASGVTLAGPNPFGAGTRVRVVARGDVRVVVVDALGREVRVLHEGTLAGGAEVLPLSGERLAPGVYTVRVASGDGVATRRLVRAR